MAKRRTQPASKPSPTLPGWLANAAGYLAGPGRRVAMALVVVAVFGGGWYLVWLQVRQRVLSSDDYVVRVEDVVTAPRPEWIRRDVRAEVLRDVGLGGGLSILDERLTERVATAFERHPWVAEVERVTRHHPARLQVDLVWRRPVCMVETADGMVPVDRLGTLLPRGDFSQVEAGRYPRIVGVDSAPVGPVGTRWGDARVVDGAEIAATFGPAWHELKLDRIVPTSLGPVYASEPVYELFTRGGTRILWGRGPASQMPSELGPEDKVARLLRYAREHGTLDGAGGPQVLDVRTLAPAEPRTARLTKS